MRICLYRFRLELPLKQGAYPLKSLVDGFGVGNQELLHGAGDLQRDFGSLWLHSHQNMIMGWHQTVGNNIHNRNKIFLNTTQEVKIIIRFKENRLSIIPAIVEMIINI